MDSLIQSHRELRAALRLCRMELRKITLTPKRSRLLVMVQRTMDNAKYAAVNTGISSMPPSMAQLAAEEARAKAEGRI
jgi:hypothetical protein